MSQRSPAEILRLVLLYGLVGFLAWLSEPEPVSATAGAVLVLAGELVRVWAAGHLHKTKELITSGPYRFTRNPLYLGRLLIFTGVALMARLPWAHANLVVLLLGWLVFFGYYMPRKERIEPARLERVHGEAYRRYYAAVPALFPHRRPWPDPGGRWRADRFRRNRELLTAVALGLLVAYFLLRAFGVVLPSRN